MLLPCFCRSRAVNRQSRVLDGSPRCGEMSGLKGQRRAALSWSSSCPRQWSWNRKSRCPSHAVQMRCRRCRWPSCERCCRPIWHLSMMSPESCCHDRSQRLWMATVHQPPARTMHIHSRMAGRWRRGTDPRWSAARGLIDRRMADRLKDRQGLHRLSLYTAERAVAESHGG